MGEWWNGFAVALRWVLLLTLVAFILAAWAGRKK